MALHLQDKIWYHFSEEKREVTEKLQHLLEDGYVIYVLNYA
jgi:hypothetical protein